MGPGSGVLEFDTARGRTVVTRSFSRNPLRVLTPQNDGEFAWAYLSSFGGGMVDGDRIDLRMQVGRKARAAVLTQSSTKIYRSPHGCSQRIDCRLKPGATLANLPDPVICFGGSHFAQAQAYDLDTDASLLVIDPMTSGRHRSGERWKFASYRSELRVSRNQEPVFFDSIYLDSAHGNLEERMGRFDSFSTLLMIGPAFAGETSAILEKVRASPLGNHADLVISASPLGSDGLVMRMAGRSTENLMLALRRFLCFLPEHFGDNPWARKW